MNEKDEISKDELFKLLFNTSESLSISNLGWWLECKTGDKYTAVERQFIIEAFEAIESCRDKIEIVEKEFKKKWSTSLSTLRRTPYKSRHK